MWDSAVVTQILRFAWLKIIRTQMLNLWKSSPLGSVEWKLYFDHVTYISHHGLQNILLFCNFVLLSFSEGGQAQKDQH